jgi:hypothetical protein
VRRIRPTSLQRLLIRARQLSCRSICEKNQQFHPFARQKLRINIHLLPHRLFYICLLPQRVLDTFMHMQHYQEVLQLLHPYQLLITPFSVTPRNLPILNYILSTFWIPTFYVDVTKKKNEIIWAIKNFIKWWGK